MLMSFLTGRSALYCPIHWDCRLATSIRCDTFQRHWFSLMSFAATFTEISLIMIEEVVIRERNENSFIVLLLLLLIPTCFNSSPVNFDLLFGQPFGIINLLCVTGPRSKKSHAPHHPRMGENHNLHKPMILGVRKHWTILWCCSK